MALFEFLKVSQKAYSKKSILTNFIYGDMIYIGNLHPPPSKKNRSST